MTKAEVLKAIRAMCIHCMGGSEGDRVYQEIQNCTASPDVKAPYTPCPLWHFRGGKDPKPSEAKQRMGKMLGDKWGKINSKSS